MLVAILTSHRSSDQIDELCEWFLNRKFEVGVILAGQDADRVLRDSKKTPECDLVYDVHEPHTLWTNFKSSVYLAAQPFIVVPATFQLNKTDELFELMNLSQTELNVHMIRARSGWPYLVTRKGLRFFMNTEGLESFSDPRILSSVVSEQLIQDHKASATAQGDLTFTDRPKSL